MVVVEAVGYFSAQKSFPPLRMASDLRDSQSDTGAERVVAASARIGRMVKRMFSVGWFGRREELGVVEER
jgi:hypothetical protein